MQINGLYAETTKAVPSCYIYFTSVLQKCQELINISRKDMNYMQKTKLEYTEKHHVLEVDGIEYEIPQRTAELEKKIVEHDKKLKDMTEYEGNMAMLEILFGKKKAAQMFPDKDKTNLDKLAKCTNVAVDLYMLEYNKLQREKLKVKMAEINPLFEKVTDIGETLKKAVEK